VVISALKGTVNNGLMMIFVYRLQ